MTKSRIFTVGFDLPGSEFEYINFDSDQTLLDADIVLYAPTLGNCQFDYLLQNTGKPVLTKSSSLSTKAKLDHWRVEIIAAVQAGKLVVVYLSKPTEHYRYSGNNEYSGTGKSRVATAILTGISSYEAVPVVKRVTPKSGSATRLEKQGSYLATYWSEFAGHSSYEVEIEGDFTGVLLKSRVGERIVGAEFRSAGGSLLFLPPLKLDGKRFIRTVKKGDDEEEFWTKEADNFGKRLVSALVGLAQNLKRDSQNTPPPDWSLSGEYQLTIESELKSNIGLLSAKIDRLQAKKADLENQIEAAGSLRHLLYESGKPLENAILEAMRLFGFDAHAFSDGKSEFDSIFVSREGRCVGEAEGKDNKAVGIEKFSQLERNLQEDFAREAVTEYAKGVLFGNAFRLRPLGDRGDYFTEKCLSAAKRVGAALVRCPDLFEPARYLREHPSDAEYAQRCRMSILNCRGAIVSFPPPPGNVAPDHSSGEMNEEIEVTTE